MISKILWAMPSVVVLLTAYNVAIKAKKQKTIRAAYLRQSVFIIYFAVLLTVTLDIDRIWVCLWHGWPLPEVHFFSGSVNIVPFKHIGRRDQQIMLLENFLLFFPFGLLIDAFVKRVNFVKTALLALLFSFVIEVVQVVIGRACDIDDLLMNTTGSCAGWALHRAIEHMKSRVCRAGSALGKTYPDNGKAKNRKTP